MNSSRVYFAGITCAVLGHVLYSRHRRGAAVKQDDDQDIVEHGKPLPRSMWSNIPQKEMFILKFLLKYIEARKLPIDGILINGGYVRDMILGTVPDDLDITLCLVECEPHVTVAWLLVDLLLFVDETNLLQDYGISSIKPFDIHGDISKSKQLDTAKAIFKVLDGSSVEVDIMPTIGEEIYDELDNRIPIRDQRGTPLQDALRRDLTIGAMFVKVERHDDLKWTLLDYYGGLLDIKRRILRAPFPQTIHHVVLSPEDSKLSQACNIDIKDHQELWWIKILRDDPLRILRAFRFSAKLGFKIHESFWRVIPFALDNLKSKVAGSRKLSEILKVVKYGKERTREFFELCFNNQFVVSDTQVSCIAPGIFGGQDGNSQAHYLPVVESFDLERFDCIFQTCVPEHGLSPDQIIGCCLALAIFCSKFLGPQTSSLGLFNTACNGLCASNELREAGSRILISYQSLNQWNEPTSVCRLFQSRLLSKYEFSKMLQIWDAMGISKHASHYSHEFVVEMLDTETQFYLRTALQLYRSTVTPTVSGKSVSKISKIPQHLRGNVISYLQVFCRLNNFSGNLDAGNCLVEYLENSNHLLEALIGEWYDNRGELKKPYCRKSNQSKSKT